MNDSGETWTDSGHILEVKISDLFDGLGMEYSMGNSEGWEDIKYDS